MTRAATTLCLSLSTVSTHIKALTHTVGCDLIRRNHDGYDPTPEGVVVLRAAAIVLDHVEIIRHVGTNRPQRSPSSGGPGSRQRDTDA